MAAHHQYQKLEPSEAEDIGQLMKIQKRGNLQMMFCNGLEVAYENW